MYLYSRSSNRKPESQASHILFCQLVCQQPVCQVPGFFILSSFSERFGEAEIETIEERLERLVYSTP